MIYKTKGLLVKISNKTSNPNEEFRKEEYVLIILFFGLKGNEMNDNSHSV